VKQSGNPRPTQVESYQAAQDNCSFCPVDNHTRCGGEVRTSLWALGKKQSVQATVKRGIKGALRLNGGEAEERGGVVPFAVGRCVRPLRCATAARKGNTLPPLPLISQFSIGAFDPSCHVACLLVFFPTLREFVLPSKRGSMGWFNGGRSTKLSGRMIGLQTLRGDGGFMMFHFAAVELRDARLGCSVFIFISLPRRVRR